MSRRTVRVSPRQVNSARLLVKLSERDGIPVDPIITKIAQAQPEGPGHRPEDAPTAVAS